MNLLGGNGKHGKISPFELNLYKTLTKNSDEKTILVSPHKHVYHCVKVPFISYILCRNIQDEQNITIN